MPTLAHERQDRFSYHEYCRWQDETRWELIDGAPYDMSAAPSRRHQSLLLKIARRIADFLDDKPCDVYIAPFDVRLPDFPEASDKEVVTVVQPDIVIVCDESKLDDRGCLGAPDFIVEILSPETAAKDMKIKRDLYERHGVREYWLVHPTDKTIMVYIAGSDGVYAKADIYAGDDVIESVAVKGLAVRLHDLFGLSPGKV